jgi:hypothetical protein
MTPTSVKIAFGFNALEIKNDGVPTCADKQTFSNLDDLITGQSTSKPYSTYEPDFWLLDGNYKFKPSTEIHIGLMSLSMSDAAGDFSVAPALTITFGSVHDSDGLTLRFAQYSNDYAVDIDIAYYDASNALIQTDNYTPDSWEFSTSEAVADFKKIIITFNTTNKPFRYLRLTGIDFGELTYFQDDEIKSAYLIQEVDIMALELPISTLEVKLIVSDATLNIINPTGAFENFQYKKPLDIYEKIGNETHYIGRFFVDRWGVTSPSEITLYCFDWIGILDKETYFDGGTLFGFSLTEQLDDFFGDFPYSLDSAIPTSQLQGRINLMSYRDALKNILMAIGGYALTAGSNIIQIIESKLVVDVADYERAITADEMALDDYELTLKPTVTGVEVVAHAWGREDPNETVLYEGVLSVGTHILIMQPPSIVYDVDGATPSGIDDGANYATVIVASPGTVTLTGHYLVNAKSEFSEYNTGLTSIDENIKRIEDNDQITNDIAAAITARLFDYFAQRYIQKAKVFANTVRPGEAVMVEVVGDNILGGFVERMESDLTGGFISRIEVVGVILE